MQHNCYHKLTLNCLAQLKDLSWFYTWCFIDWTSTCV